MSILKPKLCSLGCVGNVKEKRREAINYAKTKIFGYARGLPGEKQFMKPLQGRNYMNWYFPSRYLMPHFHVEHYLSMQIDRFKGVKSDDSMDKLVNVLEYVYKNQEKVKQFFSQIDKQTFFSSPTLQDMYSLYRTIDNSNILSFDVPTSVWKPNSFSWFHMNPNNGLNLLQHQLSKQQNEDTNNSQTESANFHDFLQQQSKANSFSQLQTAIENKLKQLDNLPIKQLLQAHTAQTATYKPLTIHTQSNTPHKQTIINKNTQNITINQNLQPATTENSTEIEEGLESIFSSNASLRQFYKKKIRFVDPLFLRKKKAFLDKLSRNRIKSDKEKEKYGGKLYTTNPNTQEVWPLNKGISSRKWPSPYH